MSYQFERIALFLSMVTELISPKKPPLGKIDLAWLKPDLTVSMDAQTYTRNEETQILAEGDERAPGLFWIANNDKIASNNQAAYLKTVGVGNYYELHDHVNKFEARLLTAMGKAASNETATLRVLSRDMMDAYGTRVSATPTIAPPRVTQVLVKDTSSFSIQPPATPISTGGTGGPFAVVQFLFIHDEYDGNKNEGKPHAEQMLLAAFSKLDKTVARGMTIGVYGCKDACSCCAPVIDRARTSLARYNCTLKSADSASRNIRVGAGFSQKQVGSSIKTLADDYYPLAPLS